MQVVPALLLCLILLLPVLFNFFISFIKLLIFNYVGKLSIA